MDEKEAIERIESTPIMRAEFALNFTGREPCELAKALKMATEALNEIALYKSGRLILVPTVVWERHCRKAENDDWIPCSDELPKEKGEYLTTTKNEEVYCDYWNGENFDRTEYIIAWMPKPQPYKPKGEKK